MAWNIYAKRARNNDPEASAAIISAFFCGCREAARSHNIRRPKTVSCIVNISRTTYMCMRYTRVQAVNTLVNEIYIMCVCVHYTCLCTMNGYSTCTPRYIIIIKYNRRLITRAREKLAAHRVQSIFSH